MESSNCLRVDFIVAICLSVHRIIAMDKQSGTLSLPKLLPNIFTTIGLCSGLTGIRFALEDDWENAVFLILIAACFDMIDGLSARLLKAFSPFGAELDSLADTISFGVAPAIITYLWIRDPILASNQLTFSNGIGYRFFSSPPATHSDLAL